MAIKRAVVLVTMLAAASAQACSGPDVHGTIARHQRFATTCAYAGGFFFLVTLVLTISRRLKTSTLWTLGAMFALHPAWTISGLHGDCGSGQVNASMSFLGTAAVLTWLLFLKWFRTGSPKFHRVATMKEPE